MTNKYHKNTTFKSPDLNERNCFPEIETERPKTEIYPEIYPPTKNEFVFINNFQKRDYQYEISKICIHYNTLVIIPTGLGKTFIAAIVIYNFYRWFPTGKIIFLAPSKPLVTQQKNEMGNKTDISRTEMAEITGEIESSKRRKLWQKSRVFFGTPQAVQRDIETKICPVSKIVLIIVDEAHKASGNHSYCQIIREVAKITRFFRVVALTATPGQNFNDVQSIIYNLMISKIQIRNDDDVSQYIHSKVVKSIVVPDTQEKKELIARLNAILKSQFEILNLDTSKMNKNMILSVMNSENHRFGNSEQQRAIKMAIKLLDLREQLESYSIPIFVQKLKESLIDDPKIPMDETYKFLKHLYNSAMKCPQDDPKMKKLCEIAVDFLQQSDDSKIIVFCSYREVVKNIVENLNQASPIIRCRDFYGQASNKTKGLNQKQQLEIMDDFRKGKYNILVSTSIGEEGLDIGEVDLIICYDAPKSPSRTIQRMGRTGRKRDGNVIFLLTESTKNLFHNAENAQNHITKLIRKQISKFEYYNSPRMNEEEQLTDILKRVNISYSQETSSTNKKKIESRATLVTKELEDMESRYGKNLKYHPLSLNAYSNYQTGEPSTMYFKQSNESKIFSNVCRSILQSSIQNSLFDIESSEDDLLDSNSENQSNIPSFSSFKTPVLDSPNLKTQASSQISESNKDDFLRKITDDYEEDSDDFRISQINNKKQKSEQHLSESNESEKNKTLPKKVSEVSASLSYSSQENQKASKKASDPIIKNTNHSTVFHKEFKSINSTNTNKQIPADKTKNKKKFEEIDLINDSSDYSEEEEVMSSSLRNFIVSSSYEQPRFKRVVRVESSSQDSDSYGNDDESSIVSSIENSSSNENKHSSPINNTKLTPNPNCSFVTNKITSDINNTYSIPKNNLNSKRYTTNQESENSKRHLDNPTKASLKEKGNSNLGNYFSIQRFESMINSEEPNLQMNEEMFESLVDESESFVSESSETINSTSDSDEVILSVKNSNSRKPRKELSKESSSDSSRSSQYASILNYTIPVLSTNKKKFTQSTQPSQTSTSKDSSSNTSSSSTFDFSCSSTE